MTKIMKTTILLLLVTGLCGRPSFAQQTQQKTDASKAMPSSSQIVLAQWNEIGRKLNRHGGGFSRRQVRFQAYASDAQFR